MIRTLDKEKVFHIKPLSKRCSKESKGCDICYCEVLSRTLVFILEIYEVFLKCCSQNDRFGRLELISQICPVYVVFTHCPKSVF